MLENFFAGDLGVPVSIALISACAGYLIRGGTARERKVLRVENHKLRTVVAQMVVDKAHARNAR